MGFGVHSRLPNAWERRLKGRLASVLRLNGSGAQGKAAEEARGASDSYVVEPLAPENTGGA